jgi:Cytochrome P460
MSKTIFVVISMCLLPLAMTCLCPKAILNAVAADNAAEFDEDGKLLLPSDYRMWVFVGATVTPNEMNGGKAAFPEFHTIYMDPASYKIYKNTGEFPEGTTMIKETLMIGAKKAPSGKGYFMGDYVLLAAGVKDSKRFGGERAGWGFFVFGSPSDPQPKSGVFPAAKCNSCHAAAAQERIFIQYYPLLHGAKQK